MVQSAGGLRQPPLFLSVRPGLRMLFFERIINPTQAPAEKRRATRYVVGSAFPLKSVLNLVGRDDNGEVLKTGDGEGWDWNGRLVNFSASGVSIQLPPATAARRGDRCTLILSLVNYQLSIPCHVAHVRSLKDSIVFGLKFEFGAGTPPPDYQQLLELVAFGASLKPEKDGAKTADGSGYLVEHYRGDFGSHLTVWRAASGGQVQWFEFQLAEFFVRGGTATPKLEFAAGQKRNVKPVSPDQVEQIHQLFRWVVPNIARSVPEDVRHSLQHFAA